MMWVLLACSALAAAVGADTDVPWYHSGVVYQIYPRSFQDTDGDGIGDLNGVLQHLDYFANLGIDAVWFSPIYPSPNEDYGYDISDYMDINPEYGTMKDFEEIITKFNSRGIKVILDFVPNHSSTEHEWFKYSEEKKVVKGVDYTNFYVWKNAKGKDKNGKPIPPNNWLGVINTGSAWEWNEKRQQFYLHNFLTHQADLNYAYQPVQEKIKDVLKFWMRKGVYGFRVDAISWVWEDQRYLDEPRSKWYDPTRPNNYNNLDHIYTMDLPQNIDIVEGWRAVIDEFSKFMQDTDERIMMLESYSSMDMLIKYYGTDKNPGATFPFNFLMLLNLNKDTNATTWKNVINAYYTATEGHWTNWVYISTGDELLNEDVTTCNQGWCPRSPGDDEREQEVRPESARLRPESARLRPEPLRPLNVGTLREFDVFKDDWALYQEQMDMFFLANAIEDNRKLGNHDQNRVLNRWGEEWVDLLHILMMTLRGTAITYYGEEIGLEDNIIRWDQNKDVQGAVAGEADFPTRSRDFERGPMPWNGASNGGFTNGSSTWLPLAPSYWRLNVAAQETAERSHLKLYRQLAALRKSITLSRGDCEVEATSDQLLYVLRSQQDNPTYITIVNIGTENVVANIHDIRDGLPSYVRLLASSTNYPQYKGEMMDSSKILMPAKTGIVVST